MDQTVITSEVIDLEPKEQYPDGGYIYSPSWFSFFISNSFLQLGDEEKKSFFATLTDFYGSFSPMYDGEESFSASGSTFNFFFRLEDEQVLMFPLSLQTTEILLKRTELILQIISGIATSIDGQRLTDIEKVYIQSNKVIYLVFNGETFVVKDPLQEAADRYNKRYMENTDRRVAKPDIILHEENLNKRFTFSANWVLQFDGLHTMMVQPNDVSIYASICEKHLQESKRFYEKTIIPRHEKYYGNFPAMETQIEYYEYFELITTALIFSITAIEALVNSLIPDNYTFTTATGKVRDKAHIERNAKLREKLKDHLTTIYQTADPETEAWWGRFINLEELRNQTIHTKQHLSEERYSKLLEMEIFNIIGVYKEVFNFYGPVIARDPSSMINEFPYNFGFDAVRPKLINDANYRKLYNNLHNPHNPL